MIRVEVTNRAGALLASAAHETEALLCLDHAWEPGDSISVFAPPQSHAEIRTDAAIPPAAVYLPEGRFLWPVPMDDARAAYSPAAFQGARHILSARLITREELARPRDLARNPLDLRGDTCFFPHCTANVETRNEAVFAARNVIDGLRYNTYHGEWPYESWGIGAREDAFCVLDFGREVVADKMALTLRADFPHDAHWVSGHAVDSNGRDVFFTLCKTGERQYIDLGRRRVRWLRLERLQKSDDPSAFPSLRAWEVFGWDE